jgi:hypothetical protein
MIPNLTGACYAAKSVVHISNINSVTSVYRTKFHSIITHGLIVWGNSSNNGKIFTLQEKIIRIMAGAQLRTSCSSLFTQLEILPVPCWYILSLMNFRIINQETFQTYLYTILIQGISTVFKCQMPTYLVFNEVHSMLA